VFQRVSAVVFIDEFNKFEIWFCFSILGFCRVSL